MNNIDLYPTVHLVWVDTTGSEIYIGAEKAITAEFIRANKIDTIITVTYGDNEDFSKENIYEVMKQVTGVNHYIFPFKDGPRSIQSPNELLNMSFAVKALVSAVQSGKKVVCHCTAGQHRSCAVVYAGLVELGHFKNPYEAYCHVSKIREVAEYYKSLVKCVDQEYQNSKVPE